MIVCVPTVNAEVVKLVTPLEFRFPVPRVVTPSLKVTAPLLGLATPLTADVTVAVKVIS